MPQVGVFPLLEIPTGNAEKGLGSGNAQVLSHYGCKRVGGNGQPMAEADALSP